MRRSLASVAVVAALALVAAGCGFVGGSDHSYKLIAYFSRAVSVFPSSQVRVLGLPAGSVDKVEPQGDRVKITMSIHSDIPIPANVHAQLVPQSLIGERYVQLMPAWTVGQPKAEPGHVIALGDTIAPVEPDEALAAVKKFLDSLDPKGLGRLINNAADALDGNGQQLNDAINQVTTLVGTFADKDQTLSEIVDNLDGFTSTLSTREAQLGDILKTFSQATDVLASERSDIQALVQSLASLSQNGLNLVAKHSADLESDLQILGRLSQSIDTNIDSLSRLLDAGPLLVNGLHGAFNPDLRATNLRTALTPLVGDILSPVLQILGLPPLGCIDIPLVQPCTSGPSAASASSRVNGQSAGSAVSTSLPAPTTPIDDLLGLLRAPTVAPPPAPSLGDHVGDGAGAVAGFVDDAAHAMVGAS